MATATQPTAPAQQVVVTGQPLGAGEPTEQGKALAERMNAIEEGKAEAGATFADRLAASGYAFYDDNAANRRYIAKIDRSELHSPFGSPMVQVRTLLWPEGEGALQGITVLREDGSSFQLPAGLKSIAEAVDPDSGKPVIPELTAKQIRDLKAAAEVGEEKSTKAKK